MKVRGKLWLQKYNDDCMAYYWQIVLITLKERFNSMKVDMDNGFMVLAITNRGGGHIIACSANRKFTLFLLYIIHFL